MKIGPLESKSNPQILRYLAKNLEEHDGDSFHLMATATMLTMIADELMETAGFIMATTKHVPREMDAETEAHSHQPAHDQAQPED